MTRWAKCRYIGRFGRSCVWSWFRIRVSTWTRRLRSVDGDTCDLSAEMDWSCLATNCLAQTGTPSDSQPPSVGPEFFGRLSAWSGSWA